MFVNGSSTLSQVAARLSNHVRLPLFRNGYALLFSGATTSALGLLYWALAARLYPAEGVGLGSALLSAMLLLSGMAQLSLNNVLIRFLPVAGARSGRLLACAYAASTLTAIVLSLVFIAGVDYWSPALGFLNHSPQWKWGFVAACTAWGVFALQDSALTGLRQTLWVPVENTLFAILKIVLLVVFAGSLLGTGIFLSWTVPVALSLLPINALIYARLLRRPAARAEPVVGLAVRPILSYIGGNYVGTLFYLVYTNLLPLLVANQVGVEAAAYFYLPWTVANGLQLVAINMATSLTVEGAINQRELHHYGRRVISQSLRLLSPAVVLIFVGAPFLLNIFGSNYSVEGTTLLRWLSVAALPNVMVVVGLGLARVQNRPVLIAAIQGATCVLSLGLTYALLPGFGISGAGIAWTCSQIIVSLAVGLWLLRPLLGSKPVEPESR